MRMAHQVTIPMLTADTITDEQIRKLRDDLLKESLNQLTNDTDACGMALRDPQSYPCHLQETASILRGIGRALCAEILNSRVDGAMLGDGRPARAER